MTELLAAIGSFGAVGGLAAVFTLAMLLRASLQTEGDARVSAENLKGQLAIVQSELATRTNEATAERQRADALYEEAMHADSHPDPVGARARVLERWREAHAAARPAAANGAGAVPHVAAAEEP